MISRRDLVLAAAGACLSRDAAAQQSEHAPTIGVLSLASRGSHVADLRSLRVCPGTSCGIAEPSQHEADRGKAEEGERLAVEVLPILGQSTAAVQPSYGAFDNPALR